MRKTDVVGYFGSEAEAARKLGITRQAVNDWPDKDMIPERSALLAQVASSGALQFNAEAYRKRRRKIAAKVRANRADA